MLVSAVLLLSLTAHAEEPPVEHAVTATGGVGQSLGMVNLSYAPYFGVGERRRFRIGPGARASGFFGSDLRLATVNTDNAGDGGADENALEVDSLLVGTVNLGLYLEYQLGQRWQLGMNWDIVGMPFGGAPATFTTPDGDRVDIDQTRSPRPSIGLTRGQVTSDNLWVGYAVTERVQLVLISNTTGIELETLEAPTHAVSERRYERTTALGVKAGVSVLLP